MRPTPRRASRAPLTAALLAVALLAVALLAAGCGAGQVSGQESGQDAAAPEPAADVAYVPTDPAPWDSDPWWWLDTAPSSDAAVTVSGVRAETLDGVDRLVLDLAGDGEPGWVAEVVESAADDGTGDPVDIAGDQIVRLRLAGVAFPVGGEPAGVEPQLLDVGGPALTQVAVRFWSEGNLNVFLGVTGHHEPQLAIALTHDPLRLTVDVPHP